jgi:hypothetical protein
MPCYSRHEIRSTTRSSYDSKIELNPNHHQQAPPQEIKLRLEASPTVPTVASSWIVRDRFPTGECFLITGAITIGQLETDTYWEE